MANLNLLKDVGNILQPLFADLSKLAADDEARSRNDKKAESSVVAKLRQFVADSSSPTAGSVAQATSVLVAFDTALTDLSIRAMSNSIALTHSQSILVQTLISNIEQKLGVLKLKGVFKTINQLLTPQDLDLIDRQLQGAEMEIAARTMAKDILDTVVDVAIVAGTLAMKLV